MYCKLLPLAVYTKGVCAHRVDPCEYNVPTRMWSGPTVFFYQKSGCSCPPSSDSEGAKMTMGTETSDLCKSSTTQRNTASSNVTMMIRLRTVSAVIQILLQTRRGWTGTFKEPTLKRGRYDTGVSRKYPCAGIGYGCENTSVQNQTLTKCTALWTPTPQSTCDTQCSFHLTVLFFSAFEFIKLTTMQKGRGVVHVWG